MGTELKDMRFAIYINNNDALKSLNQMDSETKKLEDSLQKLVTQGKAETAEYTEKNAMLKKLAEEKAKVTKESALLERQIISLEERGKQETKGYADKKLKLEALRISEAQLTEQGNKLLLEQQALIDSDKRFTKEYQATAAAIVTNKNALKDLTKEAGLNALTSRQLETLVKSLKNEFKNSIPGSDHRAKLAHELETVKHRLDEITVGAKKTGAVLQSSFSRKVEIATGVGISNIAYQAWDFAKQKFKEAIKVIDDYEIALNSMGSITGMRGKDLDQLGEKAIKMSTSFDDGKERIVKSAPEILAAMQLVGSAKPELLKNADALAEVTKNAIILSQSAGQGKLPLEDAVGALTKVMNQYNAPASKAKEYTNLFAAAAKEGAGEVPYIADAVTRFGVAAKTANIPIAQSVGMVELFAEKGFESEKAGTAMRNILVKLMADTKNYTNGQFDFNKALANLIPIQNNVTALTEKFGLENVMVAQTLAQGTDRVNYFTKAIQGTNEAYEQNALQTDNLKAKTAQMGNAWDAFILKMDKGKGKLATIVKGAVDILTGGFKNLGILAQSDIQNAQDIAVDVANAQKVVFEKGLSSALYMAKSNAANFKKWAETNGSDLLKESIKNGKAWEEQAAKEFQSNGVDILIEKQRAKLMAATLKFEKEDTQMGIYRNQPLLTSLKNERAQAQATLTMLKSLKEEMNPAPDKSSPGVTNTGGATKELDEKAKQAEKLFDSIAKYVNDVLAIEMNAEQKAYQQEIEKYQNLLKEKGLTLQQIEQLEQLHQLAMFNIKDKFYEENKAKEDAKEAAYTEQKAKKHLDDQRAIWKVEDDAEKQKALDHIKMLEDQTAKEIELRKQVTEFTMSQGKLVSDTLFTMAAQDRQYATDAELKSIDDKKTKELSATNLTEAQKAAIEKKYHDQEVKIKQKAWEDNQKAAVTQALINGGLAITNILATMPWVDFGIAHAFAIASAATTTMAQVAVIKNQKMPQFAKGKYPVVGENDGRTYSAGFGGKARTGEVSKPTMFLAGEQMPEMIIDGPTYKNIQMNYPGIIEAIKTLRMPNHFMGIGMGMINAGQLQKQSQQMSSNQIQGISLDLAILGRLEKLDEAVSKLNGHLDKGISSTITQVGLTKFDEEMTKVKNIQSGVSLT